MRDAPYLLLDEPSAALDQASIEYLLILLDEYLVNMDFLIDSFKKRGMELVTPNSKLNKP